MDFFFFRANLTELKTLFYKIVNFSKSRLTETEKWYIIVEYHIRKDRIQQKIEVFMKKLLALCLVACFVLSVFTACGDDSTDTTTASTTLSTQGTNTYDVKDGILTSCVGQADENGVYTVPEHITIIGEGAFAGDTELKEVIIGSNVELIGSGAFQNCTSLERVVIEEGVQEIGSYAFSDCVSLTDINLPSTIDYINGYAFYGCTSLEEISLEHVRYIDDGAFWYCTALERVVLSDDLEYLGCWAFAQAKSLSDISLEGKHKLETIDDYAFTGCSMLRSIVIPEGTKNIGKLVFYDCTRLADITISGTVSMIDYAAFNFTPWYQEYREDYMIVGDGILLKCNLHPNFIDIKDLPIKTLGANVFWNAAVENQASEYGYKYASELSSLTLPETLTTIGTSAFAGCYSLGKIVLPAGVTVICDNAFDIYIDGLASLTSIDYSACTSLRYIGANAFRGCTGVASMELPETVEYVGPYAFASTIAYDSFMQKASSAENEEDRYFITGDGILLAAYAPTGQTKLVVPEGVKMIAGSVFAGWDSASIPESIDSLIASGVSKYNLSYTVTEIVLPSTLEVIGDSAFYRACGIQSISFPDSLKEIGVDAFAFCDSLASISGGNNIESIGDYAFYCCLAIPGFQFSENTTYIGEGVFAGCSAIKHVYLPRGLAFPGVELFNSDCTSLSTLTMSPSARARVFAIIGGVGQAVKVYYYDN